LDANGREVSRLNDKDFIEANSQEKSIAAVAHVANHSELVAAVEQVL
jgi:hypothetical protein